MNGTANEAVKARMAALDEERQTIEASLMELKEDHPAPTLHPRAAETYGAMVARLRETLHEIGAGETRAQRDLIDAVRGLVDKIVITPLTQERGGPIEIVLHGTLARFMGQSEQPENFGLGGVVAGGGIEPPTCGL